MKTSKNNKNYIEVLGEEGWYKEEIPTNYEVDKNKAFFFKTALILILLLLVTIPININTYSKYNNEVSSNNTLHTAKWVFNVNGKTDNIDINLENTITSDNKKVVPGSYGKIDLQIDFTGTEVSSKYVIKKDDISHLPNNLKLYTDSSYTEEFKSLSSNVDLNSMNEVITTTIYWRWNYTLEDESNWMDKSINLNLRVDLSENVGDTNV